VSVPHWLSPAARLAGIGRLNVAQTLLSVLVRIGTTEKINACRRFSHPLRMTFRIFSRIAAVVDPVMHGTHEASACTLGGNH